MSHYVLNNLVPRVLSYPPYGGRVGENPGNEVVCYIVEAKVMVQFCYFKSLYLGIETVFLLFPSDVTDGKDGHGLKLQKIGSTFSKFSCNASKNNQKNICSAALAKFV